MKRLLGLSFVLIFALAACSVAPKPESVPEDGVSRMEHGGTTMNFQSEIPDVYAGMSSPVEADDASVVRGMKVYSDNCAVCHGDGGMGDGPAAEVLDPAPAPVAHTGQMMGDGYLFWRIADGGSSAGTGMLAFGEDTLDDQQIWDVINYIRALGSGDVMPPEDGMGGAAYDPEFERVQHEAKLAEALSQGLINTDQADNFMLVHDALDAYLVENDIGPGAEGMDEMQPAIFAVLVEAGTLAQQQVERFNVIHQLLLDEGLMQ